MTDIFESLEFETATEIEALAWLAYELRENRNAILEHHGVADETALLQRIQSGDVAEHPAYEHYLAARILADTRETVRTALSARLLEANRK